jgi:hypothetical protein
VSDTLTRDKGRIAIVTNRGLGSDGRDGVGRGEPCRAGNREQRLSRLRHGADSVFAWFRVRAHASSRSPSEDVRGRTSRVVLTPGVCASSPVVMWRSNRGARISHLRGDGGNSASLPGESTKDTLKPSRREGRAIRRTCGPPRVHFYRARICGCQPAPGLPCALVTTRAMRSGKARANAPREGGGVPCEKMQVDGLRKLLILRRC